MQTDTHHAGFGDCWGKYQGKVVRVYAKKAYRRIR